MSLTPDEVRAVAHLARLALNEDDVPRYAGELSKILDLVDLLENAETEGVSPMAHPLELAQRLRADVVLERNQREEFQAIAPSVEAGHYLVPRVIE